MGTRGSGQLVQISFCINDVLTIIYQAAGKIDWKDTCREIPLPKTIMIIYVMISFQHTCRIPRQYTSRNIVIFINKRPLLCFPVRQPICNTFYSQSACHSFLALYFEGELVRYLGIGVWFIFQFCPTSSRIYKTVQYFRSQVASIHVTPRRICDFLVNNFSRDG